MLSYQLTDQHTLKLKDISQLAAHKSSFLNALAEDQKDAIHRYARISTIGASTRIENAVLTDPEIDWLDETLSKDGHPTAFLKEKEYIENKLSKDRERSIEEVAGCRNMLTLLYGEAQHLFPLTGTTVKGLHQELLRFYPPAEHYAGRYKIAPNSVVEIIKGTNIRKDVLKAADPGPLTEAAMRDLLDWYNQALTANPWPIAVAVEFVFRFLAIHPFQDGNGRIGRGLFLLALLQSKDPYLANVIPYISIDRHIERNKEQYYLVLRQCSGGLFSQDPTKYQIEFFLNFMLKMLEDALTKDIDVYFQKHERFTTLPGASQKVLACFKEYPETKMGLKDIVSHTGMARSTAITALHTLVEEEFLQKVGRGPTTKYQLTF